MDSYELLNLPIDNCRPRRAFALDFDQDNVDHCKELVLIRPHLRFTARHQQRKVRLQLKRESGPSDAALA